MSLKIEHVAVIGAGISGVATAAHLKLSGLNVTVFERSPFSGGVWVFDKRLPPEPTYPSLIPSVAHDAYFHSSEADGGNSKNASNGVESNEDLEILHAPPGPCYDGLANNVPTGLMKVTLNSWKPGTEQIVRHSILAEYIQDTSSKTGVDAVTLYNTKVEHLSKEEGKWKLRASTLDTGKSEKITRYWEFDAVVVATGHYDAPKVPDIPGLQGWKQARPSQVLHSKRYRYSKDYKDKTVLLIGGSTSSTDIAKELHGSAKAIYQSTRGGLFDLPSSMLPASATRVSEVSSFNLGLERNPALEKSGAIPGTVTLVDGQILTNIDTVIICTGYHCSFPFLKQYHDDFVRAEDAGPTTIVTDGLQMHNLHKDIFYIPDPTLAFVGVPYHVATFSLFEFQAMAVGAVYSGKALLPSEEEQRAEYSRKLKEKGSGRGFHSLQGQDVDYANELLEWINPGIIASGGTPFAGHSKEWQAQFEALFSQFFEQRRLSQRKRQESGKVSKVETIEISLQSVEIQ